MLTSIVIPALNEAASLPATLDAIAANASAAEVIVVDAGSRDETRAVAAAHPLHPRLIEAEPSSRMPLTRGAALNLGARHAAGDVLWFLHADSPPVPDQLASLTRALEDEKTVGGAFEFRIRETGWRLRVVEGINRVRYRVRQRYYGDQGIFVRRSIFERLGGFREAGLMEDAHFCRDARRLGRLRLLRPSLATSGRRFIRGGVFRVLWLDVRIWAIDAIGADVQHYAARYRAENIAGDAEPSA